MLILQNVSYKHPNKDLVFNNINLSVKNNAKIAIIGNNGTGKSTLLKIIAGELHASEGQCKAEAEPYFLPQIFGQFNDLTIGEALQINDKLEALKQILEGQVTQENLNVLNDDWTIEERCKAALEFWNLSDLDLNQTLKTLSGGQKTKVFLAGISIHKPELILLDEPSNHLDKAGRQQLYDFIQRSSSTLIVVSHDRKLLNMLDTICELTPAGITVYGGNYAFYSEQKQLEKEALDHEIHNKEKALRKSREKETEILERQQKLDARGKKKQEKAGVSRIMMNTLRNNAENSTSKVKTAHADKISGIAQELQALRATLPDLDKMKLGLDNASLHKGKILFEATNLNFSYDHEFLWKEDLNFQVRSGDRIALNGGNGTGKSTLIKILLGQIEAKAGSLYRAESDYIYIDQDYSLIARNLRVYEQAQLFNASGLEEHEIKIRLNRFLFTKEYWNKKCDSLSGGERMRLILCCLTIRSQAPEIIILDEPTNNLDIQNIEILTAAINGYEGTLLVVSHDGHFLQETNVVRSIML